MIPHAGEAAALATAFCWTFTSLAFESAGRRVGSLAVNFLRLVPAFLLLLFFCWAWRGKPLPWDAGGKAWFWLSLSGVVGFSLADLCLFRAFVLIGSRLSMLLMSLVPPFTALLGWIILGESLSGIDLLGMASTVAGVSWVVAEKRPRGNHYKAGRPSAPGVLLALGAALGQAVQLVISKLGMGDYSPFGATQIRLLSGMAGFAVLFFFLGWWPKVFLAVKDRPAMVRVGFGAFFGPFLGVSLSLVSIQLTATGVASTIMALSPVLIIPFSALFFGEKITLRAVLGACLAVAGVALLFLA